MLLKLTTKLKFHLVTKTTLRSLLKILPWELKLTENTRKKKLQNRLKYL